MTTGCKASGQTLTPFAEGWGQRTSAPEVHLTDRVRELVGAHQLINSMSGWNDFAYQALNISVGDYQDNHHYSSPQCGTPFYSTASVPYDGVRIGFQGEFGGVYCFSSSCERF